MRRLILASSSPRRKELLAAAGLEFDVMAPADHAEDDQRAGESPWDFVSRMARQKAADVARQLSDGGGSEPTDAITIIGCDTVVVCGGQILGKPADLQDAQRMLQSLRGTEHQAISGLCLWQVPGDALLERVVSTTLRMSRISDSQMQEYLESGLWQGKAGGFGYQDRTGWLEIVAGSEANVVGMPIEALDKLLRR